MPRKSISSTEPLRRSSRLNTSVLPESAKPLTIESKTSDNKQLLKNEPTNKAQAEKELVANNERKIKNKELTALMLEIKRDSPNGESATTLSRTRRSSIRKAPNENTENGPKSPRKQKILSPVKPVADEEMSETSDEPVNPTTPAKKSPKSKISENNNSPLSRRISPRLAKNEKDSETKISETVKELNFDNKAACVSLQVLENESLNEKLDVLLTTVNLSYDSNEEDSSDYENSLIDNMAEEGEEDTPSEGSNDIIEAGEELNSDSVISTDGSYDSDDSFIDNDKTPELLPGEEFDLSVEDSPKKSKKKAKGSKPKSSRIIRPESSDEDVENYTPAAAQTEPLQNHSKNEVTSTIATPEKVQESKPPEKTTPSKIIIHSDIQVTTPNELFQTKILDFVNKAVDEGTKKGNGRDLALNLSVEYTKDPGTTNNLTKYSYMQKLSAYEVFQQRLKTQDNNSSVLENTNGVQPLKNKAKKRKKNKNKKNPIIDDSEASDPKKKKPKYNNEVHQRLDSGVQEVVSEEKKEVEQPTEVKRKVRRGKKVKKAQQNQSPVVTDAVVNRKGKQAVDLIQSFGLWQVESALNIKPSVSTISMEKTKKRPKEAASSSSNGVSQIKQRKLHPKDFKSTMLYDSGRINRTDTKVFLKNRGVY